MLRFLVKKIVLLDKSWYNCKIFFRKHGDSNSGLSACQAGVLLTELLRKVRGSVPMCNFVPISIYTTGLRLFSIQNDEIPHQNQEFWGFSTKKNMLTNLKFFTYERLKDVQLHSERYQTFNTCKNLVHKVIKLLIWLAYNN